MLHGRSELVALDVADLEFCDSGMRVHIRRSKTDQEGAGATIAIVAGSIACPVKAVRAWLEASASTTGPVFRPAFTTLAMERSDSRPVPTRPPFPTPSRRYGQSTCGQSAPSCKSRGARATCALKVEDIAPLGYAVKRATMRQKNTGQRVEGLAADRRP